MLLQIHSFLSQHKKQPPTLWHSLNVQSRVICALIGVFAIALTPNGQWKSWGVYGDGELMINLISRVSWLSI